jgi:hypothetical protein
MKAIGGLFGLVAALVLVLLLLEAQYTPGSGGAIPHRKEIDVAAVRNDLLAIAQAERRYFVSHGRYAGIAELQSQGYLSLSGDQRRGYKFEIVVENGKHFKVIASPIATDRAQLPSLMIDDMMRITER